MLPHIRDSLLQRLLIHQRGVRRETHEHPGTPIRALTRLSINLRLRLRVLGIVQGVERLQAVLQVVQHSTKNMILEVGANTLIFDLTLNTCSTQDVRVADPGKLEELRTIHHAPRQNDFFACGNGVSLASMYELHTRSCFAVQDNPTS